MEKPIYSPMQEAFQLKMVELRHAAGLTQRDLAEKLKCSRSFVSRVEEGQRRVDLVEFYWIVRTLGASPERTGASLLREFSKLEPKGKTIPVPRLRSRGPKRSRRGKR